MPATSWRSSPPPRSTRSTSSRSAFGCGSAARIVPTFSSIPRNCSIVIMITPPLARGRPSPRAPPPPSGRACRPRPRRRACPSGDRAPPPCCPRAPGASGAPSARAPRRPRPPPWRAAGRAAPRRRPRPRRSPRGRAGSRRASWLAVHVLELAREALAQLAGDGRRRGGWRRRRPHPAADDERHTGRARQDGSEGRHPREPVEAAKSRRGEHLLAVAGAEGGQDRVLVLAAREALGDLLLHRLARRTPQVVAGVDGEPPAAPAAERLLDLPPGRGDRGGPPGKPRPRGPPPPPAGTRPRARPPRPPTPPAPIWSPGLGVSCASMRNAFDPAMATKIDTTPTWIR